MIRAATLSDLPRLRELVREMHSRSIYADTLLDERAVQSILMDGVRRHNGKHVGATLFNVVEFRGEVEGFMLGVLQPLYMLCAGLEAQDFLLYCSKRAPVTGAALLIDAYSEWASSNPKVKAVMLSWTDALHVDGRKMGRFYTRKGFERVGEIWRRVG